MADKATLDLWNEFKETPPAVTKAFERGGGFKGKAIDPMYIVRRLTEKFGPIGTGWGYEIIDDSYHTGHPFSNNYQDKKGNHLETNYQGNTIIHKVKLRLWYMDGETQRYVGPHYGLTTFVGEYKSGPFTDEEHAKKSVTDALGKCASLLGLAADVHMGLHDDNKYVNDLRTKLNEKALKDNPPKDTSKAGVDDIPLGEPRNAEEDLSELTDEERKARGLISKAQRKRLSTIASKQGWETTAVKSLLAEHGYYSSHAIKWQDYKKIVEQIESLDMSVK